VKIRIIYLLGIVAVSASGRACGTRHVDLRATHFSSSTSCSTGTPVSVAVLQPRDNRSEDAVGRVRNGSYMRTADVVANNDVLESARSSMAESLARSGLLSKSSWRRKAEHHSQPAFSLGL